MDLTSPKLAITLTSGPSLAMMRLCLPSVRKRELIPGDYGPHTSNYFLVSCRHCRASGPGDCPGLTLTSPLLNHQGEVRGGGGGDRGEGKIWSKASKYNSGEPGKSR